ncbi:prenyltransferase/squalene oxidase repeat-containing protein [Halalkalicoccus jeotgali]|uniref:Antibiotic ABC transporter permease n=1 Tax=Halalkalicoccus jeotgali (strain DSM 18796 / CECT 7217 / JCM 14584 / KCTC 4019 / B3) TaxID=795797 RepID=D8J481_HALJB|nr:hypothetical protein [Halalkalicoccus jeotgali]ADJ15473.1 hypothetical protein HacjB3_10450 [Halalkalicoccus jeotgali B3]ELY36118.1 hypothetical protein C497_12217 [Halalkalicoccus jeotgali B3]
MSDPEIDLVTITDRCETALEWARENDYAGWDPYDGLSSSVLPDGNWLFRLCTLHAVRIAPFNVRPIAGIATERNPKGIALFALAYLDLYEVTGEETHLSSATELLDWLLRNTSPASTEPSWGYNFDWQNGREFFLPAYHPSIVVSVFCGRAFLRYYEVTGDDRALEVASGVCRFVRCEIGQERVDGYRVYAYTPYDSFVVVNVNALAAGFFAEVAAHTDDGGLGHRADRLAEFVCDQQVEDGAWYYASPPERSHISHDNFHTGFVVESLDRYMAARQPAEGVERAYERGLDFYREALFEPDGAPRYEHDRPYPQDVHAAAQAVITFARPRAESTAIAERVLAWTLSNLYDSEGYFYRQRGRFLTDRTPYIRWSQGWMCLALASYLRRTAKSWQPAVERR